MIEKLLEDLVLSSSTELIITSGEHFVKKIKNTHDIKKLFVETGEFFMDFEPEAEQLFDDLALVLSKENMTQLANEMKSDSGYTLKDRLLSALIRLMNKYEIPHDQAYLYANNILYTILGELPEVAPQQYDRHFQGEWREEQKKALATILQKIDKVTSDLQMYNNKQIEVYSADQLDMQLRRQTISPRIGIEFFEIDDDNFKKCFGEQKDNNAVYVRAKCREEAIFCIVNELWHLGEQRAIFVVKSEDDWNKLSKIPESGNIYIPWFYADEISAIENNTNIFIYTDGVPSFSKDEIVLRPRTYHTISRSLERAGMGINEANRLVYETHGLYIPMKKKIFNGQYMKKPDWVDGLSEKIKMTGLLVGQWTDADGDKEIITALCGMKYDEFIEQIKPYTTGEDPFVHIVGKHNNRSYYLASVENAWEYLDISSDNSMWKTFRELFIDVLNESEKLFVYTHQERMVAQFKGEKLFWSSVIRNGMIRSLIMKAYYKNDAEFQSTLDSLVSEILDYVKNEEQWKYLSNFFIDLCEVAPKAILDRLFMELTDTTGLLGLFEKQNSDFFFEKNNYIDILFGVDEFLVQEEYAARGFEWILRLDDRSYEYKSNSPKDTIVKVLCSWYNFSAYRSVEEKVHAATEALKLDKNAWDYVYEALPYNHRSIFGEIQKPKYRSYVETSSLSRLEVQQTVDQYIQLLIDKADFNPERWKKLLEIADELPEKVCIKIFKRMLYETAQMSEIEQMQLKNAIRQIIYKHRYFASASWAMGEEKINRYITLLDEIRIHIPEYEYEYLFDSDRDIILLDPVPYDEDNKNDENSAKIDTLIVEKIAEFKQKELNLSVLAEICAKNDRSNLGMYLALYGGEADFNEIIFKILYKAQDSRAMALDYCQGMARNDSAVFSKVMSQKNQLHFENIFIVGMYRIQALNSDDVPLIDTASDDIKKLFWRNDRVFVSRNFEWALRECKKYGTVASYIELLYRANRKLHLNDDKLYACILGINKIDHDNSTVNIGYYLTELLKPLQDHYFDDFEKASKLAEIEIAFFSILGWKNMICFQREVKRSPELYAEMVSIIYKRDDANQFIEQNEEQKKYVDVIYRLFDMTHFCPAEKNGVVNKDELEEWVIKLRDLLDRNGQNSLWGFLLGRLWAYAPVGEDNHYPCEAVRDIIEKYADDSMISEYKVAVFNKRGIFSPSAGKAELEIAERYKENADFLSLIYPTTAEIFYGLYRTYLAEAESERSRAENGYF